MAHGAIKFNWPNLESWELEQTCALDVADVARIEDGLSLEDVGRLLQLTRERVRQLEAEALEHARENETWHDVDDATAVRASANKCGGEQDVATTVTDDAGES
jgi:hypothetical protein